MLTLPRNASPLTSQLINAGVIMWGERETERERFLSLGFELHCKPVSYLPSNCCDPQINTQNGRVQQQQAGHGDILSELQSHHAVLLQPAKEVCLCGTTTAQKSDTTLRSVTDTNRHSCDWSSGRSASATAFALWWYLHYLYYFVKHFSDYL